MRYRILGTLEVLTDSGLPVVIPATKRRELLAVLLLARGRPVSFDDLADALWESDQPPAARESLQSHVSRLRGELGPGRIETVPSGYRLRVDPGELDAQLAEAEIAQGRRAAADGRVAEAREAFHRAIGRWHGQPLAEFAAKSFALPEIARLDELKDAAVEGRIAADLVLGKHAELVSELEALIAWSPYRERLWEYLMLALYRAGRQAEALAAYRRLRSKLRDELGIDPSPSVEDLQRRILRQDVALRGPDRASVRADVRLPVSHAPMYGRAVELRQAVDLLGSNRLLTMTGPGGVGKTRLAVLVAGALAASHRDGVLFVDLSASRDPTAVADRIGEIIGGGERPQDVIGERDLLLVLDNFEQVIEGAPVVGRLLSDCPNLRVLVTSRAPLRIMGERRLEVPPLSAIEAAEMFTERASAALVSAVLPPDVVADVVANLDGLPLAVELAAARVPALRLEDLRDRLSDRLAILTSGRRDAPDRHRTLRKAIGWSYDLLDPASQAALRKLSVAAGGCDVAAALVIAETDIDVLENLVQQSLVRHIEGRYWMLESIREFAGAEARRAGELEGALDRHLAHFLAVVSMARADPGDVYHELLDRRCRIERENLRVAFAHALDNRDGPTIAALFARIAMPWVRLGAIDEGIRWGEAAIEASHDLDAATRMRILMAASEFPRFSGDPIRALAGKERALEIARAEGDLAAMTIGLDDVAWTQAYMGDIAAARASIAEAYAVHELEASCDPHHRGHTVFTAAEIALFGGQPEVALELLPEVDRLENPLRPEETGDIEARLLRGKVLAALGRGEEATVVLGAVVREGVGREFRVPVAEALDVLARLRAPDDAIEAARLLGMSDRVRAEASSPSWEPALRERTIQGMRSTLGDARLAELRRDGHALDLAGIAAAVLGDSRTAIARQGAT